MSSDSLNKRKRKRAKSNSFKSVSDDIIEEMTRTTSKRLRLISELKDQIEELEGLIRDETPVYDDDTHIENSDLDNDVYINEIVGRIKTKIIGLQYSLKRAQAPSPIEAKLLVKLAEIETSIF